VTPRACVVAAACVIAALNQAQAQEIPADLAVYLREAGRLDSGRIAAAARGEAVVSVLDTDLPREIAVLGIAAVRVSRDAWVRRVLALDGSTRPPSRRRLGVFSRPPVPADVRDVVIAQQDADDLRDCRPGACPVKLPAAGMARLREEIDWSAGDTQARVSAIARQALLAYVADYRARGDAALVVYDDRGNVRASEAFTELLAQTPQLYRYVPGLQRYLTGYPSVALPGAAEVLFWSEDAVPQLRPILSVTHQVVYTPPQRPDVTLVAAKQIYANHYFEAAFDLTCFVEAPANDAGRTGYLVVLRRYRFDQLSSGGPANIRGRAVDALRRQLLNDLHRYQNPTSTPPEGQGHQ
jgi:hypothetical protein